MSTHMSAHQDVFPTEEQKKRKCCIAGSHNLTFSYTQTFSGTYIIEHLSWYSSIPLYS